MSSIGESSTNFFIHKKVSAGVKDVGHIEKFFGEQFVAQANNSWG